MPDDRAILDDVPMVTVGDLTMYYEWHGPEDGDPLVLICGLAMDVSEIGPLVDGLAARYRVLAFDNRGAGRTDHPDVPYSVEQMAADTGGLMRAVGLTHAAVLGLSMGGRTALELALSAPDLVDRLILVSTGARVHPSRARQLTLLVAAHRPRGRGGQPAYAFHHQMVASAAYDATARLGEIHVPALVLHGRRDRTAPLAMAEELHAGLADSQLRTFPGGHVFMLMGARKDFLDTVLAS